MGTPLTGNSVASTYDALLKVGGNGPVTGSLQTVSDGLGNDTALQVSSAGIKSTGTIASDGAASFGGPVTLTGGLSAPLAVAQGGTGAATVAAARTGFGFDSTTTVSYAGTTALDFSLTTDLKSVALTGNITFTTSNLASGRSYVLRIVADGSTRTLAFPAGWVFVTDKPTQIAASKTGLLVLQAYGAADADVVAAYSVQS